MLLAPKYAHTPTSAMVELSQDWGINSTESKLTRVRQTSSAGRMRTNLRAKKSTIKWPAERISRPSMARLTT